MNQSKMFLQNRFSPPEVFLTGHFCKSVVVVTGQRPPYLLFVVVTADDR